MAIKEILWTAGIVVPHDPNASEIYRWNWLDWLDGDTISGTSVIVAEAGITAALVTQGTTYTDIRISGGVAGAKLKVTNRVTSTTNARIQDRSVIFSVQER